MKLLNNDKAFTCYIAEDGSHIAIPFSSYEEALEYKEFIDSNVSKGFDECSIFDIGESLEEFPEIPGLYIFVYEYENGYSFVDVDPDGRSGLTVDELLDDGYLRKIMRERVYLFKENIFV